MPHTYTNLLVHATFSTKDRVPVLDEGTAPRVFAYMGGIVKELGGDALAINGAEDHVHMQLLLPPTLSVSDAMRVVKTNSSRWANEQRLTRQPFGWQPGYAAFSVSESSRDAVTQYIAKQRAHHKTVDFRAEFVTLLRRHGIDYDEGRVWG